MKSKRTVIIFSILLIIILIGGYFGIKYAKEKKAEESIQEYTPQQEIADEQYRETIVSLYFLNKETKEIVPEARLVDIKEVVNNPYEKLLALLIEGPKNEKLEKVIPNDTKVLKTYMENDCLTIDFSKEFLNYNKDDEKGKNNLIKSIVNTVTELTEVNKVKFLIEGESNSDFSESYVRENK